MNFRNAAYTADGRIDCEIEHPKFGWIPFTASPNDPEKRGRDLFAAAEQSGEVANYVPPVVPEVPLATQKALKLDALASRRYRAEEGGTTFGGSPLATDRTTQAKLTAAYVKASADPDYAIANWKFAPGVFSPLNAATIIAAANAMEAHVQACFTNEATISALIAGAADAAALEAIDLEAGWP